MLKYLFVIIILTLASVCAAAGTSTEVGTIQQKNGGSLAFIVRHGAVANAASLVALDKHHINSVVITMSLDDLQTLRAIVDKTMSTLVMPVPAVAHITSTDMGGVNVYDPYTHSGGSVNLFIYQTGSIRDLSVYVADSDSINKVDMWMPSRDVKKLRNLIDKTITVLGPDRPAPQDMSVPSSSSKGKAIFGVNVMDLPPSIASGLHHENMKAALIVAVNPGSISDKAGIKVGDILYEFDGKPIEKFTDLQKAVSETDVGRKVSVKFLRGEQELSIDAQF